MGEHGIHGAVLFTIFNSIRSWSCICRFNLPNLLRILHGLSCWMVSSWYLLFQEFDPFVRFLLFEVSHTEALVTRDVWFMCIQQWHLPATLYILNSPWSFLLISKCLFPPKKACDPGIECCSNFKLYSFYFYVAFLDLNSALSLQQIESFCHYVYVYWHSHYFLNN